MESNTRRTVPVGGESGPAARVEGDIGQVHASSARRELPAGTTKSRPAGRLRPIREPRAGVISGMIVPEMTPAASRLGGRGTISGKPLPDLLGESAPRGWPEVPVFKQFQQEGHPGPRVRSGTIVPDITPEAGRAYVGRYRAQSCPISPAGRGRQSAARPLSSKVCRQSAVRRRDWYQARKRLILATAPCLSLGMICGSVAAEQRALRRQS